MTASYLELVQWVQRVKTGHSAVFQAQQRGSIVSGTIPGRLPDHDKVWPEVAGYSRSSSDNGHRDAHALLRIRWDGDLTELCLLHTNVVVAVEPLAPEVLGPIRVLVVQHEQCEAPILVKGRPSCTGHSRHGIANYRCALVASRPSQALYPLQETLPRFGRARRRTHASRRCLAEGQRVGHGAGRTRRRRSWEGGWHDEEKLNDVSRNLMTLFIIYLVGAACWAVLPMHQASVVAAAVPVDPLPVVHPRTQPIGHPSWICKR